MTSPRLVFSPDGLSLAVGPWARRALSPIKLYDVHDGEVRSTWKSADVLPCYQHPAFSPKGRAGVVVGDEEGGRWDLESADDHAAGS